MSATVESLRILGPRGSGRGVILAAPHPARQWGIPYASKLVLDGSGWLSLAELKRARQLLGPVPFEVRASGLKREDLTSRRVDEVIAQVRGQVEVLDSNLPGGENPPVEVVQQLAKAGIACTLRLADDSAVSYWNSLGIGYLGLRL